MTPQSLYVLGPCIVTINQGSRTHTLVLHPGDDVTIIRPEPPPPRVFGRLMTDAVAVRDPGRGPPPEIPQDTFDPES